MSGYKNEHGGSGYGGGGYKSEYGGSGYKSEYASGGGYSGGYRNETNYKNDFGINRYSSNINQSTDAKRFDMGTGVGIASAGVLGMSKTALLGASVAKIAGAAGFTTVASIGAVPAAGALLVGFGAMALGGAAAAVLTPKIAKGAYQATKFGTHMLAEGAQMLGSGLAKGTKMLANGIKNYEPQRTSEASKGSYNKAFTANNQAAKFLQDTKAQFAQGKNTQNNLQKISDLKGLTMAQKKELSNQLSDNFIRSAAQKNNGQVNLSDVSKQVQEHQKAHGLNDKQTKQLYSRAINRFENHKKEQNITKSGMVMDNKKILTNAKSRVESNTKNAGKSVTKSVSQVKETIKKPQRDSSKSSSKQAQQHQKAPQSNERGR